MASSLERNPYSLNIIMGLQFCLQFAIVMVTASVKMEVSASNHVPTIQPALIASTVLTSFLEDPSMEDFVNVSLFTMLYLATLPSDFRCGQY